LNVDFLAPGYIQQGPILEFARLVQRIHIQNPRLEVAQAQPKGRLAT
jgi:hypothetical protein